jgi:hypothetical protein
VGALPLQILLSMLLWQLLGPSVLAGLGVMILLIQYKQRDCFESEKLQMKQVNLKKINETHE